MKGLRYTASVLLLGSGIAHVLLALLSFDDPQALPVLVFGIFYFTIGILLLANLRFAPALGIIFPLIGLAAGILVIGIPNWTLMLTFLFIIDAVVVVLCIFCNKKTSLNPIKTNMKSTMIFLSLFGLIFTVQAQEQEQKQSPRLKRFHIGLSYGYTETNMKLLYMKELFTWNEKTSEPRELTGEEIDNMNSRETFFRQFQGLTLEAGMVLLGNPESKWFIDGSILVGVASSKYQIQNNQIDTLELENKSGFKSPTASVHFNFTYKLSPHWGIAAAPHFSYAYGIDKEIKDNTYGQVENFIETRKSYYNYLYGRMNLYAVWMSKSLTISVGPGFYLLYNTNDYRINRTNPTTGDNYTTQAITHLISKDFIDGDVYIEWKVIPSLAVKGFVGIGKDLTARGSISWYF